MDTTMVDELDASRCAEFLVASTARLRAEECRLLVGVGQWAVLHNADSVDVAYGADSRVLPGTEQAKRVGGDGTPEVAEFAVDELGVYLGLPTLTAKNLLGDVLDLGHRHPLLWARVLDTATCDRVDREATAAACPQGWQARWVARRCRAAGLSLEAAQWVDRQSAHLLGSMAWGAVKDRVNELVLRADPALAEERRRAREAERKVVVSRTNDDGMKRLVIQGHAGEIIVGRGRIHQMALVLQQQGATDPISQLEANAATLLLTDPGEALRLLIVAAADDPEIRRDLRELAELNQMTEAREPGPLEGGPEDPRHPVPDDGGLFRHLRGPEVDLRRHDALEQEPPDPETAPDPEFEARVEAGCGPGATGRQSVGDGSAAEVTEEHDAAGREHAMAAGGRPPEEPPQESSARWTEPPSREWPDVPPGLDLTRLRPKVTLYLHCTPDDLRPGGAPGVVTCEQSGPLTLTEAIRLLGHAQVTIRPVLDLDKVPVHDTYRPSPLLAEAVRLVDPMTVFPFASTPSRAESVQLDHPEPYRPGVPGQTRIGNLAPLLGRNHRVKTFARGWRNAQPTPGVHLWQTRQGYGYLVDETGTHAMGKVSPGWFDALTSLITDRDLDRRLDDEERRYLAEELAADGVQDTPDWLRNPA